ncbi:FHA domain-containing protein [Actinoallomurus soli]|uniref:FHA domain-containing protein n=1 Tax=Actinoallomurus soli TaxID=2952535 RepID=UPI0020925FC0|nr:FHA domain-containing protein [Actinoallomurus soli]MCO5969883.1 FHA domain-containing protein [Actinoallomurus soli]
MAICPAGHTSTATDYCDVCGARIGGAPAVPPASSAPVTPSLGTPAPGLPTTGTPAGGEACPDCGAPRTGRFCEDCGYDYAVGGGRPTPRPPAAAPVSSPAVPVPPTPQAAAPGNPDEEDPVTRDWAPAKAPPPEPPATDWAAIVIADREYYDRVVTEDEDFTFPPYCPSRRIPLTGEQLLIGRRSASRGITPEIDLSEPPADPGVSHTHAVLLAKPDGTWTLVDPGSTNGTTINEGDTPIPVNVEVPLRDGDRVHVGVWTTITLRRLR